MTDPADPAGPVRPAGRRRGATPPGDHHVHSEWSWDAPRGDMVRSCRRAVELGLPSIAFTEHLDHTVWRVDRDALAPDDHLWTVADGAGLVRPPSLDIDGYFEALDECRTSFPHLRVLSGVELGEPHRHAASIRSLVAGRDFDRVLGSVHSLLGADGTYAEPPGLFASVAPQQVLRDYLEEVVALVESAYDFQVLAHIDYPLRSWPSEARPPDLDDVEDEVRQALRALASSGRALEVNTRLPANRRILGWWRDEGGRAVSIGSDAHAPEQVARGFEAAAQVARAYGFEPASRPHDLWGLT